MIKMNRKTLALFLIFFFVSFIFTSCILNKHYYEFYETNIPSIYNFEKISPEKYKDYFVKDVYCRIETLATNYYPNQKRESAPFEIRISCKSKNLNYNNILFKNIKIISNLQNEYFPQNDINLTFQEISDKKGIHYLVSRYKKGIHYLVSRYKKGQLLDSFNFKHSENEILTVIMDATLYYKDGKSYSKILKYILYPKTKVEYLDFISDLF